MATDFFPFPNKEASFSILERDACYGKIPEKDVHRAFEDAWNTGETEAERFLSSEMACPARMMDRLTAEGFKIEKYDEDYISGNHRYFCEYVSERNLIRIYEKSVLLWAVSNKLPYDDALNLILAHEYFHYLEWHKIGLVSRHFQVPMLKIGSLSVGKTGIAALSEIAANAFANTYYSHLCRTDCLEN